MSEMEWKLGGGLLAILAIFFLYIIFLLKIRKSLLKKDLLLTPDEVWKPFSKKVEPLGFKKEDLLYSIHQDISSTTAGLVIKDANNTILTQVICPLRKRAHSFSLAGETFIIEFPLTWKRSAILRKETTLEIVAKYSQKGFFGKPHFDISGFGEVEGKRARLSWKSSFSFWKENKMIGMAELISSLRKKGRKMVLTTDLSPEVRIFILVI